MVTLPRLPTPLRIVLGFAPFIAQGVLAPRIGGAPATLAALAFGLICLTIDLPTRRFKIVEITGVCWFIGVLIAGALGHPLAVSDGHGVVMALLAALAWVSLAVGHPFTEQYARENWPEPYWSDPAFRMINRGTTASWGVIFFADSVLLTRFAESFWLGPTVTVLTLSGTVISALAHRWSRCRGKRRKTWEATRPDSLLSRAIG